MAGPESTKAIFYALFANFGIFLSKGIAAIITQSGSMLAETIHSLADCANQVLLLFGIKHSRRPPDANHPLGYGKVIYFWSFIVAMLLFSVGGLFSIYEGYHKLHTHEPVQKIWLALTVLGISIILETFSLIGCLKEIKKVRKEISFKKWITTTRNSELIVVLGEDVAAILGLMFAFVFVLLSHIFNQPVYDAIGSILIGVILLIVSMFLISRMKTLLIGQSADPEICREIEKNIASNENIKNVYNIITIQIGSYIMLAGKIRVKSGIDIDTACRIINRLEKNVKEKYPEVRWCFIEPDIRD